MIIYWSMLLWVPLIYFVYSMEHKEAISLVDYNIQQGIHNKIPIAYAIIVIGYFIFWIGNRRYVDDTSAYISMFNNISTDFQTAWDKINWDGKNPGFDIFNIIFKCFISQDYTWWLMTIAIICGVCILIILRKYSINFFLSCFIFIASVMFTWMTNGMRQFLCVSILFLCCDWIKNGKFIRFLIAVFILSTVHTTTIMMIPIYFVARSEPWRKKIGLFIIGIILICIFSEPFFNGVDSALGNTAYAGSTSQFAEDGGVNPLRAIFCSIPAILAFIKRNTLKEYYEKYPLLPICINMSVVTASLYFVAMFTSGILIGRLPIYSDIFSLILIPYIMYLGFSKEERNIILPGYILVFTVYFYMVGPRVYDSQLTGFMG